MDENIVLKVDNLTKVFGTRIAVNNVSFYVKAGEIFGFLGPNGAGKTTTMRMICGLCKISNGEVYICGHSLKNEMEECLSNIGALIENPLMFGYMSGQDNLRYYASLHKGTLKKNIVKYAQVVGLEHRLKDKVKTYSLGMRQRLGIAQALLHNPKLLILDEPLSGLDPNGVKEMREFLKYLAHEKHVAIIISSHMLSEMEQLCDVIGVINNGELIEVKQMTSLREGIEGSKKIRIKVDFPNYAGAIIIKDLNLPVEVVGNSILVKAEEKNLNSITKMLVKHKISIFGVEYVTKTLEEVFMEVIDKKTNGKNSII